MGSQPTYEKDAFPDHRGFEMQGKEVHNKDEFEKLFKGTHEDFYKKLLQRYPDLTRSSNSIVGGRYRLKKKLGLDENDSLSNFLIQF